MKLSLKAKATLLASTLVVALLSLAGALQYQELGKDIRGVVEEQLDTLGESIAENLSGSLETHITIVEHAAATLTAETLADARRAQDFVSRQAATRVLFDGTAIIGLDGIVQVNDPPLAPGTRLDLADRPYFRRVVATGQTVVSEPLQARSGGGPAILVLSPVRSSTGRVLAYFAAGLGLERTNVLGSLAKAPLGRTGHFEVVTSGPAPVYVVHPDPARLLKPAPAVATGSLDIPYLSLAKPLRPVPWTLRLVLPVWEADAPLLEARRRLVRELAVTAVAAAVLAWLSMTWLLRPLTALRDSMERLRRNHDAPEHVDVASQDERGDLARTFVELMREMRERQAETLAICERSPLGMFRAAVDGRLTYVNEAYLQIHGLKAEDSADGWLRLVPPGQREAAQQAWADALRKPEPFFVARELVRLDGQPCQFVVRSAPVIVDGTVVCHVGTVFDATERNKQEKAQRVLTAIFETTPDYVVQTDRNGFVTYANPAVRRLEGLAPDAPVEHLNFSAFNPPQSNRRFVAEILPAVMERGVWLGESVILDGEGRNVAVNHMVIAHRNARGEIDHFSAVMRNISDAVAARHEAESSAAAMRAVAELSPSIVTVVVGADLRYRFVNSAFERLTGRKREDILGRHLTEVLSPEEVERILPFARRALAGEAVEFERESQLSGGTTVLAVSYLPIRLARGEVDGMVGVAQDITQHRQEARRLRDLSHSDPLTGLLNRAGFWASLEALMPTTSRERLTLLYLDLDRFKPVNDAHGHAAGDEVLREVGRRLKGQVRPSDIVARLGGDEFVVVLPDLPSDQLARGVADKLSAALREPISASGHAVTVGASIGVVHGLRAGECAEALVSRADRLMFEVKRAGRGPLRSDPASTKHLEVQGH